MKNTVKKKTMFLAARVMGAMTACSTMMITAFAAKDDSSEASLNDVTTPIIDLLKNVLNVLIPLVAAVGAIFCVSLGLKYSKAEEPQEREKAKQHLKSAIIGFVLIFVLIVALRIATPIFTDWMNKNSGKK
ncbi:Mbov_0395 family pilin-like conjugal transfer protein [Ruminococcus sp. FC2018]|uniref:Mbov_0395 family pilin-like conjugal transfer protein n=1 Tax=Ruminococcus sp. FC2018 TaxID=1410617 RepID=UPI000A99D49E|nr:pilin [Ruminococcus sp. FC2018]